MWISTMEGPYWKCMEANRSEVSVIPSAGWTARSARSPFTTKVDKAGTVKYECTIHPGMTGEIDVNGYVVKPVSLKMLAQIVERAFSRTVPLKPASAYQSVKLGAAPV